MLVLSDHGFSSDVTRPLTTDSRIGHGPAADWHRKFGMIVLSGAHVRAGAKLDEASVLDVAPTVLGIAGVPADGIAGVSLLPYARFDAAAARHAPVVAYGPKRAALIDWPLKLIVQERKKQNRNFLFDLAIDPREAKDLSEERAADVTRLEKLLSDLAPTL